MSQMPDTNEEFVQTDELLLDRDRKARMAVAIFTPVLISIVLFLFGRQVALWFELPIIIGELLGAISGLSLSAFFLTKSYVKNDAFTAFVTIDLLASYLGNEQVYVTYGPGLHFSYWWEARSKENVVNLIEVTEGTATQFQCKGGTIVADWSLRLRPDLRFLPQYLAGAVTVVGNGMDLIISDVAEMVHDKSVAQAIAAQSKINSYLREKYQHGSKAVTLYEQRFGVIVGDITFATLRPSTEVQKAMDGAAEQEALGGVLASSLGYRDMAEVHAAVANKSITSDQVREAQKLAMALTDNLHGLNVSEQTIRLHVEGLDPNLVAALAAAFPAVAKTLATKKPNAQSKRKPK